MPFQEALKRLAKIRNCTIEEARAEVADFTYVKMDEDGVSEINCFKNPSSSNELEKSQEDSVSNKIENDEP